MTRVVAVCRAERFSPNSVAKDRQILQAVADRLTSRGLEVTLVREEDLAASPALLPVADGYLSMARSAPVLGLLAECQRRGAWVLNSPQSVAACSRSALRRLLLRDGGIPLPPQQGSLGYWLKRGDGAAQEPGDVVFCATLSELRQAQETMALRGIAETVVEAHVAGDLLKFYGVSGTPFFRCFYPQDDGEWKFGDEKHNGEARHFHFDEAHMHRLATRMAELTGCRVYGGDAIVREDGTMVFIDFNDWPSFSRCRFDAAEAIAQTVCQTVCQAVSTGLGRSGV